MCLDVVTWTGEDPAVRTGWKWFLRARRGLVPPVFGNEEPLATGRWHHERGHRNYIDTHINDIWVDNIRDVERPRAYPKGWHVYVDQDAAVAATYGSQAEGTLLPVRYRGTVAEGTEKGQRVDVAKELWIEDPEPARGGEP